VKELPRFAEKALGSTLNLSYHFNNQTTRFRFTLDLYSFEFHEIDQNAFLMSFESNKIVCLIKCCSGDRAATQVRLSSSKNSKI